jgi:hypothetical protein
MCGPIYLRAARFAQHSLATNAEQLPNCKFHQYNCTVCIETGTLLRYCTLQWYHLHRNRYIAKSLHFAVVPSALWYSYFGNAEECPFDMHGTAMCRTRRDYAVITRQRQVKHSHGYNLLSSHTRWIHGNEEWETSTKGRAVLSIGPANVIMEVVIKVS